MPGLFGTLNIGKSGLFSQQYAIDVTSHNIANANTEGYSRQRAVMETSLPYCMPSLESTTRPGQLGTGSEVSTVKRIRDEFIDYRIRDENSKLGSYNVSGNFLSQIESMFSDAADDKGLSKSLGDFFESFNKLASNPQDSNSRVAVSTTADSLARGLNECYNKLNDLKGDVVSNIKDKVCNINSYLNQIDGYNQQIMDAKISGQEPNDLMDKRDNLLDQISSEFGISINKQNLGGIDVTPHIEAGTGPSDLNLIKAVGNENEKRISYVDSIVKTTDNADGTANYTLTYYKFGDSASSATNRVTINLNNVSSDQLKELNETRTVWADKDGIILNKDGNKLASGSNVDYKTNNLMLFKSDSGELKGFQNVESDVDSYIDNLNIIAKGVAFSINAIHSGVTGDVTSSTTIADPSKTQATQTVDYMPFFVNSDAANNKYTTDTSGNVHLLYDPNVTNHTKTNGTNNLRDVLVAEKDINAGNISVNRQIIDDPSQIKAMTHDDQFAYESYNNIDGTGNGDRARAMKQLSDTKLNLTTISSATTRSSLAGTLTNNATLGLNTIADSKDGENLTGYYAGVVEKLGTHTDDINKAVTSHQSMLDDYKQQKQETSGVSSDEEMANLVQYLHAYQANAKVIATVDQLLDVVINGLMK